MPQIRQSILYDSLINKNIKIYKNKQLTLTEEQKFIISRQKLSSILSLEEVEQLKLARQNNKQLEIMFKKNDKPKYNLDIDQNNLINREINTSKTKINNLRNQKLLQLESKIRQSIDQQLWLPQHPYVQNILMQSNQNQLFQHNQQSLNNKIFNHIKNQNQNDFILVKSSNFNSFDQNISEMQKISSFNYNPIISTLQQSNKNKPVFSTLKKSKLLQYLPTTINSQRSKKSNNNIKDQNRIKDNLQNGIIFNPINYDFKKYHKDDYLALEKWFQNNIQNTHKIKEEFEIKRQKDKTKNKESNFQQIFIQPSTNMLPFLNRLYSIYLSTFQQYIRLSYIQSSFKALFFQKIFWSFIRLFSYIIEYQHKLNYEEFKLYKKQIKQIRILYEERCNKLQKMMIKAQQQAQKTKQLRDKLSMAYITYSRVNKYLSEEIQCLHQKYNQSKSQYQMLNLKIMKLITYLNDRNMINVKQKQDSIIYYIITKNGQKLQEILTIKKINIQKKTNKFNSGKQLNDNSTTQFNAQKNNGIFQTRIGQTVRCIQHQLNKYWLNKQQSLRIRKIISQQIIERFTQDIGTSTLQKFQTNTIGFQYPQIQQKSFAQYFQQQINKQKFKYQKQKQKQNDLYISLKQLYKESNQKIQTLNIKVNQLRTQNNKKDLTIKDKDKRIKQLQKQINLIKKQKEVKNQSIQQLIKEKQELERKINSLQDNMTQTQKKLKYQLQNNNALVISNLQSKQKLQKLTFKFTSLQQKHLSLNNEYTKLQLTLPSLTTQLQQYKSKYLQIDKKLKRISQSVDKFLQFKRFDKQSIVITNVKRDLQKYFSDYFCKDADVFGLTKG